MSCRIFTAAILFTLLVGMQIFSLYHMISFEFPEKLAGYKMPVSVHHVFIAIGSLQILATGVCIVGCLVKKTGVISGAIMVGNLLTICSLIYFSVSMYLDEKGEGEEGKDNKSKIAVQMTFYAATMAVNWVAGYLSVAGVKAFRRGVAEQMQE